MQWLLADTGEIVIGDTKKLRDFADRSSAYQAKISDRDYGVEGF